MLRDKIPQHFTASAVVIHRGHILLVHHKRIGAWLPPGGHIEQYEMPHEAAVRETLEETGIAVCIKSPPVPQTGRADAFFMPSPLCLHAVRAVEKGEELYHLDLAYLCQVVDAQADGYIELSASDELPVPGSGPDVKEARWVALEDLPNWHLAANVMEIISLVASTS